MSAYRGPVTYICGGDYASLQDRESCLSPQHNWPLPRGYVDACEMAANRIAHGWANSRCPECGVYGWAPGRFEGLSGKSIEVQP